MSKSCDKYGDGGDDRSGWLIVDRSEILETRHQSAHRRSHSDCQMLTFFLYRVVFPTARTPFLMALVQRCCSTTWEGTGSTLVSSAKPGAYNLVRAGAFSVRLPASAPPVVSTSVVELLIPSDGLSFRMVAFLSSRSRSRDGLVGAGATAVGLTLRMSLSRNRGSVGAGGMFGAGTPEDESPAEEDETR